MSDAQKIQKAAFTPQSGSERGQRIPVHFNPISLVLTVANTVRANGQTSDTKQYNSSSSATLAMDLTFDSTDSGADVRLATQQIAGFMEADENQIPPIVQFEWGTFVFQGLVTSYSETIDFFSPSGVPLRAKIHLSLDRQELVFAQDQGAFGGSESGNDASVLSFSASAGVTGISAMAGVGDVGRALGAANGLDTLRFTSGPISLDASITLGGPVAFASGGAGFGIGVSGGIGVSAGAGIGISGGIGVSGGVGVSGGGGAGLSIGGSASAGVSASQGAFAGLRSSTGAPPSPPLNPRRLLPRSDSVGLATDQGATFGVGGRATLEGSASLSADVGANASLASIIRFDER